MMISMRQLQITLVGIGMGAREQMTQEAQDACSQADILFGAGRILQALEWCQVPKENIYEADKINDYLDEHKQYCRPVVAFSGDTGFYSGARRFAQLYENTPEVTLTFLPGITTVQAFAAKLHTTWQDIHLSSIHGRRENLINELRYNSRIFCLASQSSDICRISKLLLEYGYEKVKITVAQNLSYPDERITQGYPNQMIDYEEKGLCAFLLENEEERQVTYGLPDDYFIRGKVPMTKEEVRAVSVAKLHLTPESVVYDIGAGTGSVSVECAIHLKTGEVYAIERKEEAVELIRQNARKAGTDNLHVISGTAPQILAGNELPTPTHVFIGGSGRNLESILNTVYKMNPDVRIVINAVTLETQNELLTYVRKYEIMDAEIVTIQASRSELIAGYHMMKGENPVMICSMGGNFC